MVNVLFVCLGNICRSPTAHGVFRHVVEHAQLNHRIGVDSSGTGDWHLGEPPDSRSSAVAATRGYDLSDLRSRLVTVADFDHFHYVLAMDRENLHNLRAMCPADYAGNLSLFLDFLPKTSKHTGTAEVPDPYYGGPQGFDHVLDLVEEASNGLLHHIRNNHGI